MKKEELEPKKKKKIENTSKIKVKNENTTKIKTKNENTSKIKTTDLTKTNALKKLEEKQKKKSRVLKNEHLYENVEKGELGKTKQQKFNFDSNDLEDEVDTSFVEKKKKKKQEVIVEKKVYPKVLLTFLILMILSLSSFLVYHYTTFNHHKVKIVTKIKEKEVVPENIVFLGDSITHHYNLEKYYPDSNVVNSGIDGNTTEDILDDMKNRVYQYNPSKVFLLIGTNDLDRGKTVDEITNNIEKIIEEIKKERPQAELFIESVYPVNRNIKENGANRRQNQDIEAINKKIEEYCKNEKITFINTYKELEDEDGNLKEEYTEDGLHLTDEGYKIITKKLENYIK